MARDLRHDEREIAFLNACGCTVAEIAEQTYRSPRAVRAVFEKLQRRTGAQNPRQLIMLGLERGWYSSEDVLASIERRISVVQDSERS